MKYKVCVSPRKNPDNFQEFTVISHYVKDGFLYLGVGMLECGVPENVAINVRDIASFFTEDLG